jgi:hypothetical protein
MFYHIIEGFSTLINRYWPFFRTTPNKCCKTDWLIRIHAVKVKVMMPRNIQNACKGAGGYDANGKYDPFRLYDLWMCLFLWIL